MSWKKGNSKFKFSNIKKWIFVVAFFCFIAVPSIQMLTNFVDVGEVESFDEKRKMATWDEIETSSMDSIVTAFENYYKDNEKSGVWIDYSIDGKIKKKREYR